MSRAGIASTLAFAAVAGLMGALPLTARAELGLLRVGSVFEDQLTHQPTHWSGTGVLVESKGRYFVLTKGHVSQGDLSLRQNPGEIEIDGKKVKVLGRYADNGEADMEVIEIERPQERPLAHYIAGGCFRVDESVIKQWRASKSGPKIFPIAKPNGSKTDYFSLVPSWVPARPFGEWQHLAEQSPSKIAITLTSPAANDPNFYLRLSTFPLPFKDEQFFSVRIQPKMSGTPLIEEVHFRCKRDSKRFCSAYGIGGLATRTLRYRVGSFFTDPQAMNSIFKDYLAGKWGMKDGITVQMRNGLTYRNYPDGTSEVNGLSSDTGGADSGGTGGADSGGTGGGSHPTPDSGFALETDDAYAKYQIESGFVYQGKPALLLRAGGARYGDQDVYAYGSIDGLNTLKNLGAKKVLPVESGFPVTQLLKGKLGIADDRFTLDSVSKGGWSGTREVSPKREITYDHGNVHFDLEDLAGRGDHLSFDLDPLGRMTPSNYPDFVPIVQVKDPKSGETYSVDMEDLFLEPSDPFKKFDSKLRNRDGYAKHVTLIVVQLRTGAEFRMNFYLPLEPGRTAADAARFVSKDFPDAAEKLSGAVRDCAGK